jgi:O-antigen/teichoic acid export membrane protein
VADGEIRIALAVAMALTGIYFFGNTSIAVRAGYQEFHISNNLSVIANVITILFLFLLSGHDVAISHFVTAVYLPLTVLVVMDLARIMRHRPYLAPPRLPRVADMQDENLASLFRTSGSAWIGQIYGFIVAHASVVVVAHLFAAADTAAFGAMMRAMLLVNAVVGLYIWPLIPAVTDANARGEKVWAMRSYRRALLATLLAAGGAALAVAIGGDLLVKIWLGPQIVVPTPMRIGFALFFLGFNITFFGFNMCLSVGETRLLGMSYVVEIFIVGIVGLLLLPIFGASALALALGIASLSLNAWLLPLRSWRRVATDRERDMERR